MDFLENVGQQGSTRGKEDAIAEIQRLMSEYQIAPEELEVDSFEPMEMETEELEEEVDDSDKMDRKSQMIEMMRKYQG